MREKTTDPGKGYGRAFWAAVTITVVLWIIPFGGLVIYPFSFLATWAHEMGHGLAALAVGGSFERLDLFASLGGLAHTAAGGPGARAVVSAGGLLGPALFGAAVLVLGGRARWAPWVLGALAGLLVVSVALWVRNGFGTAASVAIAFCLGLGAWRLGPRARLILVQLLGIQLCLSALRGWEYLFVAEARVGGRVLPSDVSAIAEVLGGPYWLWGLLLTAVNLAILYAAYRLTRRRIAREAQPARS